MNKTKVDKIQDEKICYKRIRQKKHTRTTKKKEEKEMTWKPGRPYVYTWLRA